ncbi:MAG: hypothetical protein WCC96_04280, partial [Rhodomicrobium sp.]
LDPGSFAVMGREQKWRFRQQRTQATTGSGAQTGNVSCRAPQTGIRRQAIFRQLRVRQPFEARIRTTG